MHNLVFVALLAIQMTIGCVPRKETSAHIFKEKAFHAAVAYRNASIAMALSSGKFAVAPKSYYLLEPNYSCDVDLRVGDVIGDGAKFVCNPHHLQKGLSRGRCLYYGFGVNGNSLFEVALKRLLDCDMYTFDPTPSVVSGLMPGRLSSIGVNFLPWGLGESDSPITIKGARVDAFSLGTIRSKLVHTDRVIDILKVDVEGSEWASFDTMFRECDTSRPVAHQILVELHSATQEKIEALHNSLHRCGFRIFHKDPNLYTPRCMEYAFVHWQFLKCEH